MWPIAPEPVPLPPFFSQFGDSPRQLLHLLRERVDDAMLRHIAQADCGHGEETSFRVLDDFRKTGSVPAPLDPDTREVCQLRQYSGVEYAEGLDEEGRERFHVERAFVCAILLGSNAEPENEGFVEGENTPLVQLVESVAALGGSMPQAALKLVLWRLTFPPDLGEDRPFFGFAATLLSVLVFRTEEDGSALTGFMDWLEEEVSRQTAFQEALIEEFHQHGSRCSLEGRPYRERWLLGLTSFDQLHNVWERLARQILLERELPYSSAVNERLRHVGRLVTGEK